MEQRPFAIGGNVRTWGVLHRGLNAGITGTGNTAVARFADPLTATTRRLASNQDAASSAVLDPVIVVTDAAAGTQFQLFRPGLWRVAFITSLLGAAGATQLQVGLSVDGVAADFVAGTAPVVPNGTTVPVMLPQASLLAGAAQGHPLFVSTEIIVTEGARPVVRGLLTTGAGAAPVANTVSLNGTYMNFTWLRDHA